MDIVGAVVVFAISWWIVFLAALPIGVRSQFEDGSTVEGTEEAAPVDPDLKRKAIWATIGATVVTVILFIGFNLFLATP